MKRRVIAYMVLLISGLVFLSFTSGLADRVRDRLAYAGLVAQRGNESDPSRAAMIEIYDRTDHLVPAGATIILGDSIAFKSPFEGPCVARRGLGGERSDQLLANLGRWPSLDRAGAVVIAIGTNDVWQHRPADLGRNIAAILDRIEKPIYLVGLTANLAGIKEANQQLRQACRKNCTFIEPAGAPAADGIHLSSQGYAQIAAVAPLTCSRPL